MTDNPYHAGEIAIQDRLDMAIKMAEIGKRVIRPFMPEQHRQFFAQLCYLFVATASPEGELDAQIVSGPAGFVTSPDPVHLQISGARPRIDLQPGQPVGLLGLELHSRRRNRMNGTVASISGDTVTVRVDQSFGNCPKYIRQREFTPYVPADTPMTVPLDGLDAAAISLIRSADTFFVGSASPSATQSGMWLPDMSHRGGPPGFVQVSEDGCLLVPDYQGNFFFNTLGNFLVHPVAGLLFIDFDSGELLRLQGGVELIWEGEEMARMPDAARAWKFRPEKAERQYNGLAGRWRLL